MIASLMMYGRPELAAAHDRLWGHICRSMDQAGILAPARLSQDAEEISTWCNSDLVLSQTCGMPYRLILHDKVQLVGTPDYGVEGCAAGQYRSAIVVRKDEPRTEMLAFQGATFAYNQTISQSGFAAPYFHAQALGFWFVNRVATGGHVLSARAVAEGYADIAALDAVSWMLMQRYEPFAQDLRVLEWTAPTPGLPLITSMQHDRDVIFAAVSGAIEQLDANDRKALMLRGLVRIEKSAYLAVPTPPQETRTER